MNKVALITGGSSGIGSGAAIALADRGVDSIITFNSNETGARAVVEEVKAHGAKAIALRLDIGQSESFGQFRDEVVSALRREWNTGTFDYLVNNAGFGRMALFEDTTEALFDELMCSLLKGPFFLTQALLPLLADGGAIVNVTSNSTLHIEPGYSGYATMKGGLTLLTRYMAKEFSRRGIRVNSIAPGPTRTRMTDEAIEKYPQVIAALVEKTAFNRLGEASDVGEAIASLLSDECRWVTGQNIEASGGYRL